MPGKQVTDVQKTKFVNEYVKNGGNATQAMIKTGRKITYDSAKQLGHALVNRDDVQLEIRKALVDSGVDYNFVVKTRKEFIESGVRQLRGEKYKNEPVITSKDTNSHLLGIENILAKSWDSGSINKQNNKHLHLHLEEKDQKELLTKRQELNNWFTDIIDNE